MREYTIFTDSSCDISEELLKEWGVRYCSMTYQFDDEGVSHGNYDLPFPEFYDRMRKGGVSRTSAINMETFRELFEPELQAGKDVLYLAFSSGLSTTYQTSRIVAEELRERYPERTILVVDTLAASGGFGLLVWHAVQKRNDGTTMEEVAEYIEKIKLNLCHWFTVDDLVYLKRGGRVSAAAALVGGLLSIKPVLHVDNEGHLINMRKARGRRASVKMLADRYEETALTPFEGTIFISHGDCRDDAEYLAALLKHRFGVKVRLISWIGPVIGSHSGPGTLALFFLGKER